MHVHCATSCKIRAPTDTNCGNESNIRLTSKNLSFYVDFGLLMLMFPVALFRGVAECRVVPDRMGPMVVYPQPQSGVCQASPANSSPDD